MSDDLREKVADIIRRSTRFDLEADADAVLAVVDPDGLRADPFAGLSVLRRKSDPTELDGLRAEAERLRAGWARAFDLGVMHQGRADAAVREAAALRAQLEQWQGIAEADRVRAVTLVDANAKLRDQLIDARDQLAQVHAVVTDWGAGTVHRPRAAAYTRLRAILYPEES